MSYYEQPPIDGSGTWYQPSLSMSDSPRTLEAYAVGRLTFLVANLVEPDYLKGVGCDDSNELAPSVDLLDYYQGVLGAMDAIAKIHQRQGYKWRFDGTGEEPQEKVEGSTAKIPDLEAEAKRSFAAARGLDALTSYVTAQDVEDPELVRIKTRYVYNDKFRKKYYPVPTSIDEERAAELKKQRDEYRKRLREGIRQQEQLRAED
jgi:hypothetical protein